MEVGKRCSGSWLNRSFILEPDFKTQIWDSSIYFVENELLVYFKFLIFFLTIFIYFFFFYYFQIVILDIIKS